jgi:hypothetical protein
MWLKDIYNMSHAKAKLAPLLAMFLVVFIPVKSNDETVLAKDGDFYLLTAINSAKILKEERNMIILYIKGEGECQKCPKAKESLGQMISTYQVAYPDEPNFFIVNCENEIQICADRLKSRTLPAVDVRVSGKDSFYFGDYSVKTIDEFLKPRLVSRIEKYSPVQFEKLKENQRSNQNVIAVRKELGDSKSIRLFESLMRNEVDDKFVDCDGKTECLLMFEKNPDEDLLLILNDRMLFIKLAQEQLFKTLLQKYKEFQSPVLITFGVEFEKKVISEMNPTLVFIVDNDSAEIQEAIRIFEDQVKTHKNKLFASLIQKHRLDVKNRNIYNRFTDSIGVDDYPLPLVVMVEPDMDTMRFNKYIFSMDKVTPLTLHNYIDSWHNRRLDPTPKSEINAPTTYEGLPVLTFKDFKDRVFVAGQETVVLVHNGFDKCNRSKAMLRITKMASKETRFKSIAFMLINTQKNDLPVFISQTPSFLIFTEDLWQYPIAFDKPHPTFNDLASMLDKRKDMVKPFKTDAEFADDFDLLDEF